MQIPPNSPPPQAFSSPGTYLLQCTATVDGNPTTARVPVAVDAPLPAMFRQSFDGYTHTATFIRGDSPAWNSGARDQIIAGRWNNVPMRLLFSYDLTGLPADATIEAATFELWTDSGGGTGTLGNMELRPLLKNPTEGTGTGTSATEGAGSGVTWQSHSGGSAASDLWTTAGADFGSEVLSSAPGFDATLKNHPILFSNSAAFTAIVENARSAATPLDLLVLVTSDRGRHRQLHQPHRLGRSSRRGTSPPAHRLLSGKLRPCPFDQPDDHSRCRNARCPTRFRGPRQHHTLDADFGSGFRRISQTRPRPPPPPRFQHPGSTLLSYPPPTASHKPPLHSPSPSSHHPPHSNHG